MSYRFDNLARVLIARGDLAGAEPLVLERYQRLMERQATTPPVSKQRTVEAIEGIVRLCEAKGNQPEAAAWRTRLEAARAEQNKTVPPL